MGKQISFFMSLNDEKVFFEELRKNEELMLLQTKTEGGKTQLVQNYEQFKENKIYLATSISKIDIRSSEYIDETKSDVIEFMRSKYLELKKLEPGRLFVIPSYWINEVETKMKPVWLSQIYEKYSKWIKKNYRISKNKAYYIGEEAYQMYVHEGWQMMGGPVVIIEF